MSFTSEQISNLVRQVGITRDSELNCNECLHHVAEFAECELTGRQMPEALEAVRHHLTLCIECKEEYDELLKVLRALDDGSPAAS
jgi:RNA polymerase-binding transcription factor DksA